MSLSSLFRRIAPGYRAHRDLQEAKQVLKSTSVPSEVVAVMIPYFLRSHWWEVRNVAVKLIPKAKSGELESVLAEKLLDRDEAGIVRRNCAEVLAKMGKASVKFIPALQSALGDPYWEVRAESARALARLSSASKDAEEALLRALGGEGGPVRERNFEVRCAIAEALGSLGATERARQALARLTEDPAWIVRSQAAVGLLELATRRTDFFSFALDTITRTDLLCDGAQPRFIFRQIIDRLLERGGSGPEALDPAELRGLYFHLKHGWDRTRAGL